MLKNILFIAYYYTPVNNAGVQRIEKMVKYLPGFGWKCWVLTTGKRQKDDQDRICRAKELFKRSAEEGGYTDYSKEKGWKVWVKHFIRDYFLIPDSKIFWLPFGFIKALQIIHQQKIEFIFSSFPPAVSHLIGLLLKWSTGKTWIADFRDGWLFDALDPKLREKSFKTLICRFLERRVVQCADIILVTSPDVKEYFLKEYLLPKNKIFLITNGYDEDDFQEAEAGLNKFKQALYGELKGLGRRRKEYFIISHTGSFHFSHPGNTAKYFLKGLKKFFKDHPSARGRTRVIFAGNLTRAEKVMPAKMGLEDVVLIKGLVSHSDSIRLRLLSNCLLLIDRPLKVDQRRSSYIHGKLFEHLRANKPILALVPQGAVQDFLRKYKIGLIIKPDDVGAVAQSLLDLYNNFQKSKVNYSGMDAEDLKRFERKELAQALDRLLTKFSVLK